MSRLDELIQQYCPDGVAYVALETVCLISKGIQFNKKDMHDEGTYVVCVHFSKESKDTLEDKVKRLMRDDVKAANF